MSQITIEENVVSTITPEGRRYEMPFKQWINEISTNRMTSGSEIIPDGVKVIQTRGQYTIVVHQTNPVVRKVKWEIDDTLRREYKEVILSFPYIISMIVWNNRSCYCMYSCLYFSNAPIKKRSDMLYIAPLLNCLKCKNLCFSCLSSCSSNSIGGAIQTAVIAIFDNGFNRDLSTNNWDFYKDYYPKISTIEKWEQETKKDPTFILDIQWTGVDTLNNIVDALFIYCRNNVEPIDELVTASQLAKMLIINGERKK